MNYKLHYEKLISKARNRSILKSEYKEVHHIIPKSLGGDNSKDNLVELFPEEHLVAHLLLVKIYPHNNKLIYAANMMTNIYTKRNNNKDYAWIKNKFNLINKEKTPELRKMYSDRMREFNKTYIATDETNAKISKTVKKGWENNLKRKRTIQKGLKEKTIQTLIITYMSLNIRMVEKSFVINQFL